MCWRQCHEVKVGEQRDISPEVLEANIDDVVAWTFDERRQNDVYMMSKTTEDECQPSVSDSVNDGSKKSKRRGVAAGKKHDVDQLAVELDASTLAGEVVKPRSVLIEIASTSSSLPLM